jgi:anti-anti-sigma regulatory factor
MLLEKEKAKGYEILVLHLTAVDHMDESGS